MSYRLAAVFLVLFIIHAQGCSSSGKIRGRKAPPGQCNQENGSDCCKKGKFYTTYKCSPPVSDNTKATLTLNVNVIINIMTMTLLLWHVDLLVCTYISSRLYASSDSG